MVAGRLENAYKTLSTVETQQTEASNGCSSQSVSLVKRRVHLSKSLFALQTQPHVGSSLVLCDFLKVISGYQENL